jgi:hypothetical protein
MASVTAPRQPAERWIALVPWLFAGAAILRFAPRGLWWDEWDLADWWLRTRGRGLDLAALWEHHNEHRPVLARLLFYLAAPHGHGTVPLMVVGLIASGLSFLLLLPLLEEAASPLPRWARLAFLLGASAFYFSWAGWENLVWGMQVAWPLAQLGAVLAVRGLSALPGWRAVVAISAGLLLAFAATSHWLLLVPLVLGWLSLRWWRSRRTPAGPIALLHLGVAAATLAALVAVYLAGLARIASEGSMRVTLGSPALALDFLLVSYGNPFAYGGNGSQMLARVMGTLFAIASAAVFVLAARGRLWPHSASLRGIALGTLAAAHGAALVTLVGRGGLGSFFALAPRYVQWTLLGWLPVLAAGLHLGLAAAGDRAPGRQVQTRRALVAAVVAVLALGTMVSARIFLLTVGTRLPARHAGEACLAEVLSTPHLLGDRSECLHALYADPQRLVAIARRLPPTIKGTAPGDR